MRVLFLFGGFHWVTVRGKQASPKDAPILAVAPHSTYFDALPVVLMGGPGVVAKGETGRLPLFGSTICLLYQSAARNECAEIMHIKI
jgi:lysophosphatidylcholine acyltransferase/lyso-PAF acetyltransferase